MGSGFKDFAAGDILTANDVDGYLMRQTVMTFADASARDSALSGVLDEGMMAYLEDTNRTTYYDGSAWQDIAKSSSIGTWTAYTPTFTNLTIGNGTVNFRYTRLNNLVTVSGSITWGTTTTSAGSNFIASLPVTAANTLGQGAARYFEDGVGSYLGVVTLNDVLTMTWVQDDVTSFFGLVNINGPFAWGTGDIHSFTLTYEAA